MNRRTWSQPLDEELHCLTFAPLAWLKLQFLCHAGPSEIGGFGISSEKNLLYIEDFQTVRQQATEVSVHFDDEAIADFFDRCVDQGLKPERFARIWLHTHPMASPMPSQVDEKTFARSFGRCDWSLMFIVGHTGLTYARLAFSAGPGGQELLPVQVDWSALPHALSENAGALAALIADWRQEYSANVEISKDLFFDLSLPSPQEIDQRSPWWEAHPWREELDRVHYSPTEEVLHDFVF